MTLFAQTIALLPRENFDSIVKKLNTDKHAKGFSSWPHLVAMLFGQFSKSEGLRDICNGLMSAQGNLNHLGITSPVKRSTLSYQNQHRNWELFRDFYFSCKDRLFGEGNRSLRRSLKKLKRKIYMLDATLVSVCLNSFDWAHYRQSKGALKLHMLLDFDGCLPQYIHLTDGRQHETKIAKEIPIAKGSVVVGDRGYMDFVLFNLWHNQGVSFVVRAKDSIKLDVVKEYEPGHAPVLHDKDVFPSLEPSQKKYSGPLRLVEVWDEDNQQTIQLLTNQTSWTAQTIAELYKQRWSIEIFFRDIKTHLKIKSFLGTNENAVLIQIWTAMLTILLLKYLKWKAKHKWSLANLINFVRITLLSKIKLFYWLDNPFIPEDLNTDAPPDQLLIQF